MRQIAKPSGTANRGDTAATRLKQAANRWLARTGAYGWADLLFVPVVIVGLIVYFSTTNEYFLTEQNITNVFLQASVLAIVAFGVTFVILTGELDLSVGSGVALVSVLAAFVMRDTGSIPLGIAAALGAGLVIGIVNGLIITKLEVPSFIATFGMLVMLHGIALAATDGGVVTGLPLEIGKLASQGFLGIRWLVWMTIVVFAVLYFIQTQTAFGVRVFAVGGNRPAAHLAGIKVNRVRATVFIISGITVALGALALTARLQSGQPNGGGLLELDAITAIVIGGTSILGGRGSLVRTAFGVLLIAILRNGLDLDGVGDDLKQIIIGFVLIGAASAEFIRGRLPRRREQAALASASEPASA